MTERDRTGAYNPFEDTGDWPFRESAPPPVGQPESSGGPFDREAHEPEPASEADPAPDPPFRLDERRPEAVVELEAEPGVCIFTGEPSRQRVIFAREMLVARRRQQVTRVGVFCLNAPERFKRRAPRWQSPEQVQLRADFLKLHSHSHKRSVLDRFDRVTDIGETTREIVIGEAGEIDEIADPVARQLHGTRIVAVSTRSAASWGLSRLRRTSSSMLS